MLSQRVLVSAMLVADSSAFSIGAAGIRAPVSRTVPIVMQGEPGKYSAPELAQAALGSLLGRAPTPTAGGKPAPQPWLAPPSSENPLPPPFESNEPARTLSAADRLLLRLGMKREEECELEPAEDGDNLIEQIKCAGRAGIISYALWEGAFWVGSGGVAALTFYLATGGLPDLTNAEDQAKVGASAFAYVNVARFAVPLRIGLALGTVPWVDENIVKRFLEKDDASPSPSSSAAVAAPAGMGVPPAVAAAGVWPPGATKYSAPELAQAAVGSLLGRAPTPTADGKPAPQPWLAPPASATPRQGGVRPSAVLHASALDGAPKTTRQGGVRPSATPPVATPLSKAATVTAAADATRDSEPSVVPSVGVPAASGGGKGFGGGEATRDPEPTVVDPNDPKGKQQAIHKAESFNDYLAKRKAAGGGELGSES